MVLDLLFGVLPIDCGGSVIVFVCCLLLCALSSFAIILKRKRELVALLLLSYGCLVTVNILWLPHRAVGWSAVCDCDIS